MKLAEALIERKGLQKKIERLSERLVNNAKTQEGETPSENPLELIKEINGTNEELTHLIIEINKTNALVYLNPAQMPVVTLAGQHRSMSKPARNDPCPCGGVPQSGPDFVIARCT